MSNAVVFAKMLVTAGCILAASSWSGLACNSKGPRGLFQQSGTEFQSSLRDTPNGNCHLLLAPTLAIESLAALAKVVEPGSGRTIL
jgi:hypothetical protein